MDSMDINLLAQNGDIAWRMPSDWTFSMTDAHGQRMEHCVAENDKLYVGFFDIGLLSDGTLHRLHLRADPNKDQVRQPVEALSIRVRDAIRRCTAHMRLLDHEQSSFDCCASVPSEQYCLHVWVAAYSKRQEWLSKQKPVSAGQQKRVQASDGSSRWSASDWSSGSHWHGWQYNKRYCP